MMRRCFSISPDCIIVGAGLAGSVIARFAAEELQLKVLVIEKKEHIGGHMYDEKDVTGVLIHRYGPHIFHTNKQELVTYINRFAHWRKFNCTCMAQIDGVFTPTPFNFHTIDYFYPFSQAEELKRRMLEQYSSRHEVSVLELMNSDDPQIKAYASFLFEKDYQPYTAKQWGLSPESISPQVLARVPIRLSYETSCFLDTYQLLPEEGYTSFFQSILNHPNISVQLNTNALDLLDIDLERNEVLFEGIAVTMPVVYTGMPDALLHNRFGKLPYRSLRFVWENPQCSSYQPAAVVAYPQHPDYIRITEYTKFSSVPSRDVTVIAKEYSLPATEESNQEPYYPIITPENLLSVDRYKAALSQIPSLFLCGRLAEYRYYNMDETLEAALNTCSMLEKFLG